MKSVMEIFEKIAKDIPRCSGDANAMMDFIENFAKAEGYTVEIDKVGNILCQKDSPKICLQAHYDMVCVGDTNPIQPIIKDGWMSAENSSLGADNGIGVAMVLSFMPHFKDVEFLFTSDEEIGLIGAKNIALKILSDKLLNLDSEEEGAIYVACAGGADTLFSKEYETKEAAGEFWEVSLLGLPGGHSGVDIDKKIPNAIIELAKKLLSKNAQIASFEGGEKRNSIPANAKAVVLLENTEEFDGFEIKKAERAPILTESKEFLKAVANIPNGVFDFNLELGVVEDSSNIGILSLKNGLCSIRVSSRSMSHRGLERAKEEVGEHFAHYGYKARTEDSYEPWEWNADEFCVFIKSVYKKYFFNANFKAIHAGLECAALKKSFPNVSFASVGPNIEYPHSLKERMEIESVSRTYEAIFEILRQVEAS